MSGIDSPDRAGRLYRYRMPDLPTPTPPSEQMELRQWLEKLLTEWGVHFAHNDEFWESDNGGEAIYGWGTKIERGPGRVPLQVWYDGLDSDIAIWGRGYEYFEWQNLGDMPRVLTDIEKKLRALLDARTRRALRKLLT
jgi:hypothetical protein